MVTKKDFNSIANIIQIHLGNGPIKDVLVIRLADYFEKENPNFNRGMFIHACYNDKQRKVA
jgi:hypothetical protein